MPIVKLGDVTDSCLGKMLDEEKNQGDLQPYLANINVRWGNFDTRNLSLMRFKDSEEERYGIKRGDLIVCEGGEPGRCAIWDGSIPKMKIQKALHRVRARDGVDIRYIYYWLLWAGQKGSLKCYFTGSTIKHLPGDKLKEIEINLPEYSVQSSVSDTLDIIEHKIKINSQINDNLQQIINTLYEYWFYQFCFPNNENKPYREAVGQFVWNDTVKRSIPCGWKVQNLYDNDLFTVIPSGVQPFKQKTYYATADINGTTLTDGTPIDYSTRESRANMQPRLHSVWFAKMKNSVKHLFLNNEMQDFIDRSILSTGFYGFQCSNLSFEYIASLILAPQFEMLKDRLSHGATQQGIGDDDLRNMALVVPDEATLAKFHNATKQYFAQWTKNIAETKRLVALRDFLLPMLMNGQATIAE